MLYNEIIKLSEHFQPVVDIQNEVEMYWKKFIPNDQFYQVLSKTLSSFDSTKPEERQPIWLQGTYGTGKSHATTVIKHLLYDDYDKIEDFGIDEPQIKFKLKNFRDKKRVFPVILKGTANVFDNRTFALAVEKAVKEALKKENIKITTKTDFEEIVLKLRGDEINWDKVFKGTELEVFGSKDDIISKLENLDTTILIKIEDILSEKRISFHKEDISSWLEEVINELRELRVADHLMIYWDEFTGIFELPKFGIILTELQSIAELSHKGIYLFVISHRRPHQTKLAREDVEKILGRFKVLDYSMETITTYHIINASIIKSDKNEWDKLKNRHIGALNDLIKHIVGAEGTNIQKSLGNLFPIHPYTAYLATFIARNIGSTERSIFKFLYDDEKGLRRFINENPENEGRIFLTVDYIWDFFYEDFSRSDDIRILSVLERFKLYQNRLEEKGSAYLNIFKGILILNLLYKVVETVNETSLVTPSEVNIKNLFEGCIPEETINQILTFINDQQIIIKNPDDLYILTSSGLNQKEVENQKEKLKGNYKNIDSVLTKEQKESIENSIRNSVLRQIEISILDNTLTEHLIKNKLRNLFKEESKLHLCLFLGKDKESFNQITSKLKDLCNEKDYENIIFALSEEILEEKQFNQFLSYKASAIVSEKHNYDEDKITNDEFSRKIIDKWVNSVKSSYVQWFFRKRNGKELMDQFGDKISKDFSRKIFYLGIDNIQRTLKHKTVWDRRHSKKAIEIFLFSNNREEIELKLLSGMEKPLKEIIKDNNEEYILDSALEFKENVDDNNPLKAMDSQIRNVFEKENGNFNLGIDLKFLNEPPFGLYPNMFNQGAFAFLMRRYISNLYNTGTGTPIQKENMRDKIIELFKYWETGRGIEKLEVRFGSADEEKLIDLLNKLFKFGDIRSLNDTRWRIRDWIKNIGYPIWVLKLAKENNKNSLNAIDTIFKFISATDKELKEEIISQYLDDIELAKFELKLILSKNNQDAMFQKWLETIEDLEITKEELPDIQDFIFEHMQEEIAYWTEAKTKEMALHWKVKKQEEEQRKQKEKLEEEQRKQKEKLEEEQEKLEEAKRKQEQEQEKLEEAKRKQEQEQKKLEEELRQKHKAKNTKEIQVKLESFDKQVESCDDKVLRNAIRKIIHDNPELVSIMIEYLEG